ncbi:transcription factor IIIA-like [Stigmatopora argus]
MEEAGPRHKRYICSFADCPAAYNRQWKLDAHMCSHTGVKPHACPQDGCNKSFCTTYHLARHQLTHSGLCNFPCEVTGCGKVFGTNANRKRHFIQVHAEGETTGCYACTVDVCDAVFKKHQQLRRHMSESHKHVPAYACTYDGCDKRFNFPSRLKRHLKVHQGYPCNHTDCTFSGSTWTEYVKHRKEHHQRQLLCPECGKFFKDSWFLKQHQLVHADTRKVYLCPREACDRSFVSISNLQMHLRSFHEKLRPFACNHPGCERTFTMKICLQRHSVVHDPQRKKMQRKEPRPKRSRPKRSLASRLSGCSEKLAKCEAPKAQNLSGQVELVHLLQDTILLGGSTQEL